METPSRIGKVLRTLTDPEKPMGTPKLVGELRAGDIATFGNGMEFMVQTVKTVGNIPVKMEVEETITEKLYSLDHTCMHLTCYVED